MNPFIRSLGESAENDEMSTAPAQIVCTPGTCGGRPRLAGHRLDIVWYAEIVSMHGDVAHDRIRRGWPYLRRDQLQCLDDYLESHPEWQGASNAH